MAKNYGLLCFSKAWTNPLLWSHYADRHKGVALEFEIEDKYISEVNYHPERLLLDIDQKPSSSGLAENDVHRLLTTKFEHWKYEEEVRVFKRKSDSTIEGEVWFSEFGGPINLIGVIHGPLCQLSESDIASKLPRGKSVNVVKARLGFTSFSVVKNQLPGVRVVHGNA